MLSRSRRRRPHHATLRGYRLPPPTPRPRAAGPLHRPPHPLRFRRHYPHRNRGQRQSRQALPGRGLLHPPPLRRHGPRQILIAFSCHPSKFLSCHPSKFLSCHPSPQAEDLLLSLTLPLSWLFFLSSPESLPLPKSNVGIRCCT